MARRQGFFDDVMRKHRLRSPLSLAWALSSGIN